MNQPSAIINHLRISGSGHHTLAARLILSSEPFAAKRADSSRSYRRSVHCHQGLLLLSIAR